MSTRNSVSILALTLALGAGMLTTPAFADLPNKPGDIRVMDTNKNGRIEKDEYLAHMAKMFDKAAGTKGYCTFEEVIQGFRGNTDWMNPGQN
ncbi:MAG: hypothetical protein HZA63_00505 [Rhodocyclales bacterium]|nr:hypothetical protein [Rhodocyclales bacterium]